MSPGEPKLWLKTPLIYSTHISARLDADVYLKMETLQPSQSFKSRGISLFAQRALQEHGPSVHLIIASGGNAGLAAATAAKTLGVKCTVYLPDGANESILRFFKQVGAEVSIAGKYYSEALKHAEAAVALDSNAVMVPAYDNPVLWEGHASMITEIHDQIPNLKPDAILCSVGGGGLLGGVIMGCKAVGWDDVPVVALETTGSNCFYQSIRANEGPFLDSPLKPLEGVTIVKDEMHEVNVALLPKLTSRASSLGASSPSPGVVQMALKRPGGIKCVCIPDELAMDTSIQFAEDHKTLVELACSTTLAPAYHKDFLDRLVKPKEDGSRRVLVFVVCGGFKISLEELAEYQSIVQAQSDAHWDILCNGEQWDISKA